MDVYDGLTLIIMDSARVFKNETVEEHPGFSENLIHMNLTSWITLLYVIITLYVMQQVSHHHLFLVTHIQEVPTKSLSQRSL